MNTDVRQILASTMPAFAHEKLELIVEPDFDERDQRNWIRNATVDLSQVVGMTHSDYGGKTWLELIGGPSGEPMAHLSRVDRVLKDGLRNPSYYFSSEKKEHWSFTKRDGKLYVNTGHHRTVFARFLLELNGLPPIVSGVDLVEVTPYKPEPAPRDVPTGLLSALRRFFAPTSG
ncbi:hypothetical protein P245_20235 [Comamonas thiooxydans]|uniref:Uncharacterized protein n=1 Tax=Comamonas thiooxydans TaxID=363952 RepID=A0A0E3BGC7_9BURK|nr:hypothetical protein [Comamonas thiooxydans]KGG87395.1 hypothetical protein P245_20235 [Comamonas thiooxydans]